MSPKLGLQDLMRSRHRNAVALANVQAVSPIPTGALDEGQKTTCKVGDSALSCALPVRQDQALDPAEVQGFESLRRPSSAFPTGVVPILNSPQILLSVSKRRAWRQIGVACHEVG